MLETTRKYLKSTKNQNQLNKVTKKLSISGKECWNNPNYSIKDITKDQISKKVEQVRKKLVNVYRSLEENQIWLEMPSVLKHDVINITMQTEFQSGDLIG